MKTSTNFMKIIAIGAVIAIALAGCGGKKNSGGGSGGGDSGDSGAAKTSVPSVGKAAPATDFGYDLSKDGNGVVIKNYTGKGGKLVIPAEIEGLPVVQIGDSDYSFTAGVFFGENDRDYGPGQEITSVVIPASMKKICAGAFYGIENLQSVTFLGETVELGDFVFNQCVNLSEVKFPDNFTLTFTYPGDDVFKGDTKLPLTTRKKLQDLGYKGNF